jgi:hypothetical protein
LNPHKLKPPLSPYRATQGNMDAYDGEAVNPKHLSLIERLLGYGE